MFLTDDFVQWYAHRKVNWGWNSGPNALGEITYRRTYSRDGEQWWQTVRRVVEGVYEILRGHCSHYNIPFDYELAQADAKEMYDLIFNFKFLPPGRGLWAMGTDYVRERTAMPLYNCAMASTEDLGKDPVKPFAFIMDVSMLGVGCGFDVAGAGKVSWNPISYETNGVFVIEDSREGWVDSLKEILYWGFGMRLHRPVFDYSYIRPAGAKINGFGGVSEGPDPLVRLHHSLFGLIENRVGHEISIRDIVDIANMIGVCVVSGNVRRTALIALGPAGDREFLNLKNYKENPDRESFGWTSNNSVLADVGMSYKRFKAKIRDNGEPGFIWLDNMRQFGRMSEAPNYRDKRVMGVNPCGEISLESYEVCNLVETFPHHHQDIEEFRKTLKYALIFAKAVTLIPTHWVETNAVMMRNRRIGASMSGVAQFITHRGKNELKKWCAEGYKTLQYYDRVYSEWLCVRESIKLTTIKPSGTTSLLAGATPGCHYPTYKHYIRRIRFSENHPDVQAFRDAGYNVATSKNEPNTVVVEFPVEGDPKVNTEREVSIGEKIAVAAFLQKWWADNQVSCTVSFDPSSETNSVPDLLSAYETQLKSISFLPFPEDSSYEQMPYEPITKGQYNEMVALVKPIKWRNNSVHDMEDSLCDSSVCEISSVVV